MKFLKFATNCFYVFVLSYGIFYMSYKFGVPSMGNNDFEKYEKMVDKPFDLSVAEAPWITRQIPTGIAYLIKQCNIYYPNKISFANYPSYKNLDTQKKYFSLILANYLAFMASIILLLYYFGSKYNVEKFKNIRNTVLLFCIGYFMVPVNIIAPLTEAYGWLSASLFAIGFQKKNTQLILLSFLIAAFSRETFLLYAIFFLGLFVLTQRKMLADFYKTIVLWMGAAIMMYLIILLVRYQLEVGHGSLKRFSFVYFSGIKHNIPDFIFQAILSQLLLVLIFKGIFKINRQLFFPLLIPILAALLIIDNGIGRIIGEAVPLLIFFSIEEWGWKKKKPI